jgi:hypothetical protein
MARKESLGHPSEWKAPTPRSPRELISEVYPNVDPEIDSGQVFWNGLLDNSIPNSVLAENIGLIAPMVHKLPELPMYYKAAVLLLKLRADGKLLTPEEPEPEKKVRRFKKPRKSPKR